MNQFTEDYYKTNNYVDYLDRGDKYERLAHEIYSFLRSLNINDGPTLDFGCAVGHFLLALKKYIPDSYGVDISEWAIEQAIKKNLQVQKEVDYSKNYTTVFALDVLEHLETDQLINFFNQIQTQLLIFRIPICEKENEDYVFEVSRNDPTHIICWTKEQWKTFFKEYKYHAVDLNLHTIYCSDGVYSGIAFKL